VALAQDQVLLPAFEGAGLAQVSVDFKAIDVKVFLEELGIRNAYEMRGRSGLEIKFSCPFPFHKNGDQDPSASMNAESTAYRCWGCGKKGNAVTFLADLENVSPILAARWIRERFQGGFRDVDATGLWAELRGVLDRKVEEYVPLPVLDEDEVAKRAIDWQKAWKIAASGEFLPNPIRYMFDRGFTWDTLEEWDFGYDQVSQRVCFALRDHEANLIGLKGRAYESDQQPKYLVLGDAPEQDRGYGFQAVQVTRYVYGMHKALYHSRKRIIVVEGELNCVSMHQKGFHNAVGISGQFLHDDQARIIRHFSDEAVLLFDDFEHAFNAGAKLEPYMKTRVCEPHEGDPAELSADAIDALVQTSISTLIAGMV
jgi:DNA primase